MDGLSPNTANDLVTLPESESCGGVALEHPFTVSAKKHSFVSIEAEQPLFRAGSTLRTTTNDEPCTSRIQVLYAYSVAK